MGIILRKKRYSLLQVDILGWPFHAPSPSDGKLMPTVWKPPSTYSTSPLIPAARSEHRNAAALPTSSMVTFRPMGETAATWASILRSPGIPAAESVLMGPADTA